MKPEGFSGTVEVEFPGNQGTIFIVSGEIINAEVSKGNRFKADDRTRRPWRIFLASQTRRMGFSVSTECPLTEWPL